MAVIVIVRGNAGELREDIEAGQHRLVADEPLEAGGKDTGATPYHLLLAALGACTAITLRMYAQHKGWPLADVEVRLRHEKVHADDCANCETQDRALDSIEREIVLHGPLDQVQRERLLQIANRCPVHRTLTSEIRISTRLSA